MASTAVRYIVGSLLIAGTALSASAPQAVGVYDSSWSRDSSGVLRNGTSASFQCNSTTKIVSSTCP